MQIFPPVLSLQCAACEDTTTTTITTRYRCFPVVWAPEFQLHDYDSKIADMTNLQNDTVNASVSSAGLFIHEVGFAGKYKGKWLHVDMAYPVEAEGRGTGWGVGLLLKMIKAA